MKKFFIKTIFLAPVPVLLVALNYFIDPAHIFDSRFEEGIAKHLLNGMNVTNVYNYDERLLQKYYIEGLNNEPEVVVLGSSRIMLMGSSFFPGKRLVNNGVSGGQIEDMMAVFNLYLKKDFIPKKVILGLDPWMLNENNNDTRWLSLKDDYIDMVRRLKIEIKDSLLATEENRKYGELFSLDYFQNSLRNVLKFGINRYFLTQDAVNNGFTRLSDGSICYDKKYRERTPAEVELTVKSYIGLKPIYLLGGFSHLSGRKIEQIEKFIDFLLEEKIEVVLFLAPYHPKVYNYLISNAQYKIILEAEDYYNAMALRKKINILGSFDPNKYEIDSYFFYDGMHFKEDAIPLILKLS